MGLNVIFIFRGNYLEMAAGYQRKRGQGQGVLDSWPKKKSKPDREEESDEDDDTGTDGTQGTVLIWGSSTKCVNRRAHKERMIWLM